MLNSVLHEQPFNSAHYLYLLRVDLHSATNPSIFYFLLVKF